MMIRAIRYGLRNFSRSSISSGYRLISSDQASTSAGDGDRSTDQFGDYRGPQESSGNRRPVESLKEYEARRKTKRSRAIDRSSESGDRKNRSVRNDRMDRTGGRSDQVDRMDGGGRNDRMNRGARDQESTRRPTEKRSVSVSIRNQPRSKSSSDRFGTLAIEDKKIDGFDGHDSKLDATGEEDEEEENVEYRNFVVKKRTNQEFRSMQRKLGDEGKLPEMVAVMEQRMREDRVKPDRRNYLEAISQLGRHGQPRKAFELHKRMERLGIRAGKAIRASLFNACANCSPIEKEWAVNRAKLLLNDSRSKGGTELDRVVYNAAIKAFARHNEIGMAFRVADSMITDGYRPALDTFNNLLQACVSDRSAGFKLALDLLGAMRAAGLKPDVRFYNTLLRACRDCGLGATSDQKLRELMDEHRAGIQNANERQTSLLTVGREIPSLEDLNKELDRLDADETNGTTEVASAKREETTVAVVQRPRINLKLALLGGLDGFLRSMDTDRARPDVKTFAVLFSLLAISNAVDEQRLYGIMKDKRVTPDVDLINFLIYRRCKRGEFESALELLDECKAYNLQLSTRTFANLAMGCKKREMGLGLLRDMQALGLTPDIYVLTPLLLHSLRKEKCYDFFYAMTVMSCMRKFKIELDQSHLKHLEERRREAVEFEEKQKKMGESNSNLNLPPVWGLKEFSNYYEFWLGLMKMRDSAVDPKLTLLDKKVNTDDLREDWEKPWVAQMEREKEREEARKASVIPVA